ncbi:Helix-turn-helix domain protein [Botrimarina colliarenosi]|uniref:Helix-turn-helix domain protein n=1 Tax=Botrimarina colliarenosi TaxID=2528001 RepID=A0A5C6AJW2_9BACT|nr:helix-turn-helix domain-containing protein [Botrimarina colliarenosi]TWT99787.1 Helix-turn-helix domain protein [Botrimarina colliarenosi]
MGKTFSISVDDDFFRELRDTVVKEILDARSWPPDRITLTEDEAAKACGLGRHVLRDLRQSGKIEFTKIGKRIMYRPSDLMGLIERESSQNKGGP